MTTTCQKQVFRFRDFEGEHISFTVPSEATSIKVGNDPLEFEQLAAFEKSGEAGALTYTTQTPMTQWATHWDGSKYWIDELILEVTIMEG